LLQKGKKSSQQLFKAVTTAKPGLQASTASAVIHKEHTKYLEELIYKLATKQTCLIYGTFLLNEP
jgi:hypothetical protein